MATACIRRAGAGVNRRIRQMIQAKQDLLAALRDAIEQVSPGASAAAVFESPKQAAHGDLAVTTAMQLAKPLKKNPREVAQALIDAICHLFETQGYQVTREFYYNDAGVQIATLAASVQARIRGFKPGDAEWPDAAYNGDYIQDIADDFMARRTVKADDREFTA